jgi:di/tricarboxylate transporter
MSWLFVISLILIIVGAAFSILRDPQTIDYCRTIVNDERKDDYAHNVMALYKAGIIMLIVGAVLLVVAIVLIAEKVS